MTQKIIDKLNFRKNGLVHTPINKWELIDGNILVIYQGDRGQNPKLDFIVKYRKPNCRLRTPSHTHWIVDLIIKHGFSPNVVKDFVLDWLNLYDTIEPFKTENERINYELIYNDFFTEKYYDMDNLTEFSVEFLSGIIELFIKCEKQTDNAYMFKNMLKLMMEYCENQKDYYQIISHSKRV